MTEYKFKIGQPVYYRPAKHSIAGHTNYLYHVINRLPPIDDEYQYRIKNDHTGHEWLASERELRPANPLGGK
jgi:hypothetical protein